MRSPSWSVSPPGTPADSVPSTSTSTKVPRGLIPPQPTHADDDSELELPEASKLLQVPQINPNPAPKIGPNAPSIHIKSNEDTILDQGHRPWTNEEIGALIEGITDPDHPEHFQLAQAKGFSGQVAGRWSQFSKAVLNGQRSGRAAWTKLKEIKNTYREVRDLHTQTGNGGLLQLEDNDSKAETMQKLRTRLKKLESRVGKLKYVTDKEVYYSWVKGGQSSWFARMHARFGDDMVLQRPIERSSGRLSPRVQIEAADDDDDMSESLSEAPQRRHSTTPDARSTTPDAPSTPSSIVQSSKRGKKRKLGARDGSEAPDGPSSKADKLLDRMLDVLPPPIPPSIHKRRLALDEKKLEMEDKRANKNTTILEKRLELEIKQLEAESKRRQRRWDLEDEDRKRRQAEDDSTRGASQGRANIEFLLKLAKPTAEGGIDNEAFRKHAESAAFTLVDALTRQTLEGLSKHQVVHSSNPDVDMDGNIGEVRNNQ
ncbi:unnamed protein product [Rhizoctonia solani]|uniref:Uncharacterized protein n=1 Tax=Rhizoctonia solani TaxID=456999 RepID=A0A8H3E4I6_9AGAM|nr:unnamed protein product [Rhizoctonia solani]